MRHYASLFLHQLPLLNVIFTIICIVNAASYLDLWITTVESEMKNKFQTRITDVLGPPHDVRVLSRGVEINIWTKKKVENKMTSHLAI